MAAVPESYMGKRKWIKKHFGDWAHKKLILTHRKDLMKGHYLIDDRVMHGVENFEGHFLQFGSKVYPTWEIILKYLL